MKLDVPQQLPTINATPEQLAKMRKILIGAVTTVGIESQLGAELAWVYSMLPK
jgi:hypothetical protein